MALTKEFKIKMQIDTKDFNKGLSSSEKSMERFAGLNEALVASIIELEKSLGDLNLQRLMPPKDSLASILKNRDALEDFAEAAIVAQANVQDLMPLTSQLERASGTLSKSIGVTAEELAALNQVIVEGGYSDSIADTEAYVRTLNNFVASTNDQEKALALVAVQIERARREQEALDKATKAAVSTNQLSTESFNNLKIVSAQTGEEIAVLTAEADKSASMLSRMAGFSTILGGTFAAYKLGAFQQLGKKATESVAMLGQLKVGAIQLSNVLKGTFGASILSVVEVLGLLAPGMFLLGSAMEKSENGFISAAGSIVKFAGLLVTSVAGAIAFVLQKIGGFIQAIGEGMVRSLVEAEEKFKKFEVTMRQFTFVVTNFNKELGSKTVGSLSLWNEQLELLVENTTFSRDAIAKSIKLMVAEGSILGLSVEQTTKLLQLSADVASATGNELEDVTLRMLTAISQNASAVLSLGLDIREHNLAQTELMKASGLTVEQLTKEEQVQVRLAAVFKKSVPLLGAAKDATESIAGAELQLQKAATDLAVIYGEQAEFTKKLILLKTDLYKALLKLPKGMISFIGGVQDFVGTVLIVVGAIVKWASGLFLLVLAFKFVSAALSTYLGVTLSLSSAIGFLLKRIFPIVAALYTLSTAWDELTKDGTAFADTLNTLTDNMRIFGGATEDSTEKVGLFGRIFRVAVDLAKISITGLLQLILGLQVGLIQLRKMFANKEELVAFDLMLDEIGQNITKLDNSVQPAWASIEKFGGGVAYAGEQLDEMGKKADDAAALADSFRKRVTEAAAKINEGFDKAAESQKVLGNEFEKAIGSIIQTKKEIDNVFKGKGTEQETARKLAETQQKLFSEELQAQRLKMDTLKDLGRQAKEIRLEELKDAGKMSEAIRVEFADRRALVEEQIKGIKSLGKLRQDDLKTIEEIRKALGEAEQAALGKEARDEAKKRLDQALDTLKSLEEQTRDLNKEAAKRGKTAIEMAFIEQGAANIAADALQAQLLGMGELNAAAQDSIDKFKEAAKAKADFAAIDAAKAELATMNPVANAAGNAGIFVSEKINEAFKFSNDIFGTTFKAISAEAVAKFAVAFGAFFDSFEGFIGGGAKLLGASLVAGASYLDGKLGTSFANGAAMVAEAIGVFGTVMGAVVDYGFAAFKTLITADLVKSFEDGLKTLVDFPKVMMESFKNIDEILTRGVAEFGNILTSLVQKAPELISKLASQLPKLLQMIVQALPQIGKVIVDAIPVILQALLDALPGLIRAISSVIQMIIRAIPEMITQIMDALPEIITALFEEIPKIFSEIFKAIPSIIENLLENIDEFVLAFVEGFIAAMGDIVAAFIDEFIMGGGIERIIGAILRAIPRIALALVQGIIRGLVRALSSIFGSLFGDFKLPDSIEKLPDRIAEGAKKLVKDISKDASQIFAVKDLEDSVKKLDAGDKIKDAIEDATDYSVEKLKNVWAMIREKFMAVVNYFRDIWMNLMNFFKQLWDGIVEAFTMVIDSFKNIWEGLMNLFHNAINALRTSLAGGVNSLRSAAEYLNNAFNNAKNFGANMWKGFTDALAGAGNFFGNMGSNIWNGLFEGVKSLPKFFEDMLNSINPANILQKMFRKGSDDDRGPVEHALSRLTGQKIDVPFVNFADGGLVPGNALVPGDNVMNDRILAMLSPGEAVIPRSLMNDSRVKNVVNNILNGQVDKLLHLYPGKNAVEGTGKRASDTAANYDPTNPGSITREAFTDPQAAYERMEQQARDIGGTVSDEYKKAVAYLEQFDPTKLWEKLKEKGMGSFLDMMNNGEKFHTGGMVPAMAGGGIMGDVPIVAQAGEFVLNRRATAANKPLLNQMNAGTSFAGAGGITIQKIEINAKTNLDADGIRREVIPAIEKHLKRRSQDGEFVLSARGIRDK